MAPTLSDRLSALRQRLELLSSGEFEQGSVLLRALVRFAPRESEPPLGLIESLDHDLDAVGLHTSMDAQLLAILGVREGRVGALSQGLRSRVEEALDQYAKALGRVERAALAGEASAASVRRLKPAEDALSRAVRVVQIFEQTSPADEWVLLRSAAPGFAPPPQSARLAVAEFWAERARANATDLVQKRRDLDAAHELLLSVGDELDRERVHRLRKSVAFARERLRDEPAVRSLSELIRQIRAEARAGHREAYARVRALYERAVEAEEVELARASFSALSPLLAESRTGLISAVEQAEPLRRAEWAGASGRQEDSLDARLFDLASGQDEKALEVFDLAVGAERYFDVEESLSQAVVEATGRARRPELRRVPYPTQTLTLEHTGGLDSLSDFVISDPRRLIYDLASNRQQVRAYLEEVRAPAPKRVRKSAVRVYVCDASGSMFGKRARMRNALLISELNQLRRRARQGQPFDPLYFSFFNDRATELVRVDCLEEATRKMVDLFNGQPAEGQTDITLALLAAFDSIRAARGRDPQLSRATVVLITDGEDRVDLARVRKARAPVGDVELSLSFISLGEENRDLRALALEQRRAGGRAFYHHLSDRELAAARTAFDSYRYTLLPRYLELSAETLRLLTPHLDALEAVARRAPVLPVVTDSAFSAFFPSENGAKGARVDERSERCTDIVSAVAEAAALAPFDGRASESVQLLLHLLRVYGLEKASYLESVVTAPPALRQAIDRVRLICRGVS